MAMDEPFDQRKYLEQLYNAQEAVEQSSGIFSCLGVKFQSKLGVIAISPSPTLTYQHIYVDEKSVVYVLGRREDCDVVMESIRDITYNYRTLHHMHMPARMLTLKLGEESHYYICFT